MLSPTNKKSINRFLKDSKILSGVYFLNSDINADEKVLLNFDKMIFMFAIKIMI